MKMLLLSFLNHTNHQSPKTLSAEQIKLMNQRYILSSSHISLCLHGVGDKYDTAMPFPVLVPFNLHLKVSDTVGA